ncbi:MAG: metallophosphatase family protein [Candidatus Omnitrophica bacterium]|nr:metallophosphatase family protein [Candidatus Omnitrophota bacterium]MBU4478163.1 metallophosphatase family protein [Candidatus Omnitrophota bacterium]MCG2703084.1 metallophosphatase family protein [Candidatus Omnitrophota bacterium]
MRYGIFSDVHGNLEALEAVLKAYKHESIDRFICLGDIVGYGADPSQCLSAIQRLNADIIAGNHDWGVAGISIEAFNIYAKEAILWTRERLSAKDKEFLEHLPLQYIDENIECVHGALHHPDIFPYLHTIEQAREDFNLMKRPVAFLGHTHIPQVFTFAAGKAQALRRQRVLLSVGKLCICNVGSVGQPRDGIPLASYCIFDTKKKLVEIKRIKYNIIQAQSKIKDACLPEFLATRLGQGR